MSLYSPSQITFQRVAVTLQRQARQARDRALAVQGLRVTVMVAATMCRPMEAEAEAEAEVAADPAHRSPGTLKLEGSLAEATIPVRVVQGADTQVTTLSTLGDAEQ